MRLFLLLFCLNSVNLCYCQTRDPNTRKDIANVFWNPEYTLFDLFTDEPIYPQVNGKYAIWYSSNEDPIPRFKELTAEQLRVFAFYKFKSLENCRKWCDGKQRSTATAAARTAASTNQALREIHGQNIPEEFLVTRNEDGSYDLQTKNQTKIAQNVEDIFVTKLGELLIKASIDRIYAVYKNENVLRDNGSTITKVSILTKQLCAPNTNSADWYEVLHLKHNSPGTFLVYTDADFNIILSNDFHKLQYFFYIDVNPDKPIPVQVELHTLSGTRTIMKNIYETDEGKLTFINSGYKNDKRTIELKV